MMILLVRLDLHHAGWATTTRRARSRYAFQAKAAPRVAVAEAPLFSFSLCGLEKWEKGEEGREGTDTRVLSHAPPPPVRSFFTLSPVARSLRTPADVPWLLTSSNVLRRFLAFLNATGTAVLEGRLCQNVILLTRCCEIGLSPFRTG